MLDRINHLIEGHSHFYNNPLNDMRTPTGRLRCLLDSHLEDITAAGPVASSLMLGSASRTLHATLGIFETVGIYSLGKYT